jgi:hypothetical protein
MGVAQTLLQPNHSLPIRGKAEMARLYNPGMHGANRDLVQAFAFRPKECIRLLIALRLRLFCQRMALAPSAMIEPGPLVWQTYGIEAKQIPERAFKPDRRRMQPSHGRKTPIGALNGRHDDIFLAFIEDCHVDRRPISPKAEQAPAALSQPRRQETPEILVHDDSRAWPMPFDTSSIRDQLGKRRHKWLFLFLLKKDPHVLTKQTRDVLKPSHQRRR